MVFIQKYELNMLLKYVQRLSHSTVAIRLETRFSLSPFNFFFKKNCFLSLTHNMVSVWINWKYSKLNTYQISAVFHAFYFIFFFMSMEEFWNNILSLSTYVQWKHGVYSTHVEHFLFGSVSQFIEWLEWNNVKCTHSPS